MEALRWLEYLKLDGKVVINNYEIKPVPTLSGKIDYPQGIIEEISEKTNTVIIDAAKNARDIGNPKVMNVILLGATIKSMGLDYINWEKIIKENVKEQFVDINIKAFKRGISLIE